MVVVDTTRAQIVTDAGLIIPEHKCSPLTANSRDALKEATGYVGRGAEIGRS